MLCCLQIKCSKRIFTTKDHCNLVVTASIFLGKCGNFFRFLRKPSYSNRNFREASETGRKLSKNLEILLLFLFKLTGLLEMCCWRRVFSLTSDHSTRISVICCWADGRKKWAQTRSLSLKIWISSPCWQMQQRLVVIFLINYCSFESM